MNYDPRKRTIHLQEMGYILSMIGRVQGSGCKPWIPTIPDGNRWTFLEMDGRMLKRYCVLLGCSKDELRG